MNKKITVWLTLTLVLSFSTVSYGEQKEISCFTKSGKLGVSHPNYECSISPGGLVNLSLAKSDGSTSPICNSLGIISLTVLREGKQEAVYLDGKWTTQKSLLKKQTPEEIIIQQINEYKNPEKGLDISLITEIHFYRDQVYFEIAETFLNKGAETSFGWIGFYNTPSNSLNRVVVMDEKLGKQEAGVVSLALKPAPAFYGSLAAESSSFIYASDAEGWQVEFSSPDRYPLFYAFTSVGDSYYIHYLEYTGRCFNEEKKRTGAFTLLPDETFSFTVRITPGPLSL
ncbi:MAG: hypothetical protein ABII89_04490 [Candidatus Omnitrophota bacterium]